MIVIRKVRNDGKTGRIYAGVDQKGKAIFRYQNEGRVQVYSSLKSARSVLSRVKNNIASRQVQLAA